MKLWQLEARALPITVRPIGGETIPSFTRRLSQANDLSPTTILRAIGELQNTGSGLHLMDRDAEINAEALDRLETYSGISRHRLQRALPSLRWGHPYASQITPLPAGGAMLRCYRPQPQPRAACRGCATRAAAADMTAPPLLRPTTMPLICRPHRRWLGGPSQTAQLDISGASETLTAYLRYQRLFASRDRPLVIRELRNAQIITASWAGPDPQFIPPWQYKIKVRYLPYPELRTRWQDRASRLGLPDALEHPGRHPAVTFPEAVTLTKILTDLTWRRHVALAQFHELDRFRNHIAGRLGQEPGRIRLGANELQTWIDTLRYRFQTTRFSLTYRPQPIPEICHFT